MKYNNNGGSTGFHCCQKISKISKKKIQFNGRNFETTFETAQRRL
jgi:hypothetical protein